MTNQTFVGIQISPISFIDEGVDTAARHAAERFGINVLLIGTISWLGLKVGRRISWKLDGWPDHGVPEADRHEGRLLHRAAPGVLPAHRHPGLPRPGRDDAGKDMLAMVIPAAKARGMQVIPEVMEPLFKYAGHGSANNVGIPNMPQVLEVDVYGRYGPEPCINNPDYRRWWYS